VIPCTDVVDWGGDHDACFAAMMWIKNNGFEAPYEMYYAEFGLNSSSTLGEIQGFLYENEQKNCPMPCHKENVSASSNLTFEDRDLASSYTSSLVAVLSAATNVERRQAIRDTFYEAQLGDASVLRFFVCEEIPTDSDEGQSDVLIVPCDEGIYGGYLARKTKNILNVFNSDYDRSLLILLEDDTFVAWRRLQSFFEGIAPIQNPVRYFNAYMGVPYGAGHPVNRIPESSLFQPRDVYPNETYPMYMDRSFTVLGRELVRQIVGTGLSERLQLRNRDAALGVWVDRLKQDGVDVRYVSIPGLHSIGDGTWLGCNRTWAEFPFLIQHGMEPQDIKCLGKADAEEDPSAPIEPCFPACKDVMPIIEDSMEVDKKSLGPADR